MADIKLKNTYAVSVEDPAQGYSSIYAGAGANAGLWLRKTDGSDTRIGPLPDGSGVGDLLYWDGTSWVGTSAVGVRSYGAVVTNQLAIGPYDGSSALTAGMLQWDGSSFMGYDGVAWAPIGALPDGTVTNSTIRWDGADWVECANLLVSSDGDVYVGGSQREGVVTLVAAPSVDIDWSAGTTYFCQITTATAFTFSNLPPSGQCQEICLYVQQGGAGSNSITFPVTVTFGDGGTPVYSSTVGQYDVIVFRKLGSLTNVTGVYVGGGYS